MPPRDRIDRNLCIFDEDIRFHLPDINPLAATGGLEPRTQVDPETIRRAVGRLSSGICERWLQHLNVAWETLGEDYELWNEFEYQKDGPISYDELMGWGGDEDGHNDI